MTWHFSVIRTISSEYLRWVQVSTARKRKFVYRVKGQMRRE